MELLKLFAFIHGFLSENSDESNEDKPSKTTEGKAKAPAKSDYHVQGEPQQAANRDELEDQRLVVMGKDGSSSHLHKFIFQKPPLWGFFYAEYYNRLELSVKAKG